MVSKILAAASLVALPTAVYAGLSTNGTASTTDQPNILVLLPDEWRWDWAGFDGNVETPIIHSLAKGGVRFSHAVTPTPLCDPARASLALGREVGASTINFHLAPCNPIYTDPHFQIWEEPMCTTPQHSAPLNRAHTSHNPHRTTVSVRRDDGRRQLARSAA
jgi:hypothetical protein